MYSYIIHHIVIDKIVISMTYLSYSEFNDQWYRSCFDFKQHFHHQNRIFIPFTFININNTIQSTIINLIFII